MQENNNFCRIKEQHYHVIAALDQLTESFKKILQNPIQFLAYTHASDFNSTKHNLSTSLFTVKFFEKFEQAVICNRQHQLDLCSAKRKLPNIFELETVKENVHVQTDFIPTCTFNQFFCIYQNISYAELLKIIDIVISEYGSLIIDNDNVKLTFDMN